MSEYTAQQAFDILSDAIGRFLADEMTAAQLYGWLLHEYHVPPETPADDPANRLWQRAITNVAVFTACDMKRPMLEASLRQLLEESRQGAYTGFTPVTTSECFFAMAKDGKLPHPLLYRASGSREYK